MKRETREVNDTTSPSADVSFLYAQDRATFGGSGNVTLGGKIRAFYERRVRLLTIFALACILSVSGVLIAISFGKANRMRTQFIASEANAINTMVMHSITAKSRSIDTDNYDDSILDKYIVIGDSISLDFEPQIQALLQNDVVEYLDDIVVQANQLLDNIDKELSEVAIDDVASSNATVRGFSFSAAWVEWGINIPLAVINASLIVAKAVPFVGKTLFVQAVKKAIPTALAVLASLNSALTSVRNIVSGIMGSSSDATILRWITMGGIVANIIDMVDKDGFNGYITF